MKRQLQFFCFNFFNNFKKPTCHLKWGPHGRTTDSQLRLQLQLQLEQRPRLRLRVRLQLHLEVTQTATYALQRHLNVLLCRVVCLFVLLACRHVSGAAPRGPKTSGALNLSLGSVAHLENYITAANTHQLFKYLNVLIAQRQFYWTLTT